MEDPDSTMPAAWTPADAWVMTAVAGAAGPALSDVIAYGDACNHAILAHEELVTGVGRLVASGLMEPAAPDRLTLTAAGVDVAGRRSGGLSCSPQIVRKKSASDRLALTRSTAGLTCWSASRVRRACRVRLTDEQTPERPEGRLPDLRWPPVRVGSLRRKVGTLRRGRSRPVPTWVQSADRLSKLPTQRAGTGPHEARAKPPQARAPSSTASSMQRRRAGEKS